MEQERRSEEEAIFDLHANLKAVENWNEFPPGLLMHTCQPKFTKMQDTTWNFAGFLSILQDSIIIISCDT